MKDFLSQLLDGTNSGSLGHRLRSSVQMDGSTGHLQVLSQQLYRKAK